MDTDYELTFSIPAGQAWNDFEQNTSLIYNSVQVVREDKGTIDTITLNGEEIKIFERDEDDLDEEEEIDYELGEDEEEEDTENEGNKTTYYDCDIITNITSISKTEESKITFHISAKTDKLDDILEALRLDSGQLNLDILKGTEGGTD